MRRFKTAILAMALFSTTATGALAFGILPGAVPPAASTASEKAPDAAVAIPLPFGGQAGLASTVGGIIKNLVGLIGIIAFLMFLYGGWMYLFSRGEPAAIKKGQETMIWAAVGLIVIFTSYAGVQFVLKLSSGQSPF